MTDPRTTGPESIRVELGDGQVAWIDARDEWVTAYGWGVKTTPSGRIYAGRWVPFGGKSGRGTAILLHREIAGAEKGDSVRFKDGNTMNCRRENLRLLRKGQEVTA